MLNRTKDQNRVAYFLDMGLGKTFVGSEKAISFPHKILIVCQKSKIHDWIEHFRQYYPLTIFDLTVKAQLTEYISIIGQCTGIINYDLIFRRKELLRLQNFTLMLDESSLIQNETAKRAKFILSLNPTNVILLSGTPSSGKYENLWSQIHLLGWNISKNLYNRQYVNWITKDIGGFPMKLVDPVEPYKNVDRLKAKLREHGAVFMKTEECFELPEQTFVSIRVRPIKEYWQFLKNGLVTMDGDELVGDSTLSKRLYARMLCGQYNSEKLQALHDLVESTNDRLIVFYNFNRERDLLMEVIDKPISQINGEIKDLNAYETEENSITLVQYQAGAMGLNLQKANKIIYFTLPERSELFEQSKKRIHRIGQKSICFYYTLICEGSVEEAVLKNLERRKDFNDRLFEEWERSQ